MRRFNLLRIEDESGVSGTGRVAEGVSFSDGKAVLHWVSLSNASGVSSTTVYDSMRDLVAVHGHGGRTEVEWLD